MTPVLLIVINYRSSELLPGLLASVSEPQLQTKIAVLDNASTEESFAPLAQLRDPRVLLLRSKENLGFTGGINHVLRAPEVNAAIYKYFFLLNPDAFSRPGLIAELVQLLEKNPDAACVSPRITFLDGKPWFQGAQIHYEKGAVLMQQDSADAVGAPVVNTDVFNGCAALFDMKKVQEVGLFNEDLFMYYDEADMSIRLKKAGYRILFAPGLHIRHDVSYTTRNISHLKTYYMTRNRFMVFGNTMSVGSKLYFLAHEFAFHCKNRRLKNVWYHIRGYLDFRRGKVGALQVQAK